MKLIISIVFIISTSLASAQTPDYFSDNPKWRQSSSCAVPYPCIENQEFVYYIDGDSIVDDLVYRKLYKRGELYQYPLDDPPNPCNESYEFDQFHSLLRQEDKKIYIYGDNEDTLLYDFDLIVGDTLAMTFNQWYENIVVTSIDSILVGNHYRKIFNLDNVENPLLIEGIGHEHGFIEPFLPIFECGNFLNCFSANDTTYYPNFNESCDFNVDIEERTARSTIRFFPNPAHDYLSIQFESNEQIEEVYSYTAIGKQQKMEFQEVEGNLIKVDLSNLKPGLYIIQLLRGKKTIHRFKVLRI